MLLPAGAHAQHEITASNQRPGRPTGEFWMGFFGLLLIAFVVLVIVFGIQEMTEDLWRIGE